MGFRPSRPRIGDKSTAGLQLRSEKLLTQEGALEGREGNDLVLSRTRARHQEGGQEQEGKGAIAPPSEASSYCFIPS
jgi:hypothetical protein